MKNVFTLVAFVLCLFIGQTAMAVNSPAWQKEAATEINMDAFKHMTPQDFVNMTPKQYREATGDKLNFKEVVALKAAQKRVKKHMNGNDEPTDEKALIFLLAFFIPPLAVYFCYDIGKEFWTNLILTLLCGIPGIIHAFVVCSKYYK